MKSETVQKVRKMYACPEAVEWLSEQKTVTQAWESCERGDWMLWLLGKLSGEPGGEKRKKLVLAACKCARLSLKYVKKGEERPLAAIQTAEKWAEGKATLEEVRAAASYAADAASYASYAASYAASAASYVDPAYAASYAASAASYAASYAAYADERKNVLKKCADIVRSIYPTPPRLA